MEKSQIQAIRDIVRTHTADLEEQRTALKHQISVIWDYAVPGTGFEGKQAFLHLNHYRDQLRLVNIRLKKMRSLNKTIKNELFA